MKSKDLKQTRSRAAMCKCLKFGLIVTGLVGKAASHNINGEIAVCIRDDMNFEKDSNVS